MKVTGPGRPDSPRRAEGVASSAAAEGVEAARAVDAVSIAGIPDGELTPRVRAALSSLMQEVADLRHELSQARQKMVELETLASADPLLGILNRRAFVAELNRSLAMVDRYGQPASLVFVDLDDLKKINDGRGHAAGDAALKHVVAVISDNIRQTDVFARLGGDEFALILTNAGKDVAAQKAAALAEKVCATPSPEGIAVSITCGVVEIVKGVTAEAALIAADKIMYEQKKRR